MTKPLSDDAKAIYCGHFLNGDKSTLTYILEGGKMRVTIRALAAFDELVASGALTQTLSRGTRTLRGTTPAGGQGWFTNGLEMMTFMDSNRFASFVKNKQDPGTWQIGTG